MQGDNITQEITPPEIIRDANILKTIEYVNAKPMQGIREDLNLPIIKLQSGNTTVLQPDPENKDSNNPQLLFTPLAGRAGIKIDNIVADERNFSAILLKGIGSLNSLRDKNSQSLFSRLDNRFQQTKVEHRGHASGYLTKSEAYLDSRNSLMLDKLGIRCRLPIKGYEIRTLQLDGRQMTSEELVRELANDNEDESPYVQETALRSPFRLSEVTSIINEAVETRNIAGIEEVVKISLKQAIKDDNDVYKQLGEKWKDKLSKPDAVLTPEDTYSILQDFSLAYLQITGDNFGKLHNANMIHGNPHTQNITFMGELCDNVTIRNLQGVKEKDANFTKIDELRSLYREHLSTIEKALRNFKDQFVPDQEEISAQILEGTLISAYKSANPNFLGQNETLADAWQRVNS